MFISLLENVILSSKLITLATDYKDKAYLITMSQIARLSFYC